MKAQMVDIAADVIGPRSPTGAQGQTRAGVICIAVTTASQRFQTVSQPVNISTNAQHSIVLTATYSANTSGNSVTLMQYLLEALN